jgi:hypothetical protein
VRTDRFNFITSVNEADEWRVLEGIVGPHEVEIVLLGDGDGAIAGDQFAAGMGQPVGP